MLETVQFNPLRIS